MDEKLSSDITQMAEFRVRKAYKKNWYGIKHTGLCPKLKAYGETCNCGSKSAQGFMFETAGIGEIMFKTYDHYWSRGTVDEYIKLISVIQRKGSYNKGLLEVIRPDVPIRLYMDIDAPEDKGGSDKLLETLLMRIREFHWLKDEDIAISGSCGQKGNKKYWSYHLVFKDIIFENNDALKASGANDWVAMLSHEFPSVDSCLFKRFQCFKSPNQSKKEKVPRIQKIINGEVADHLVQVPGGKVSTIKNKHFWIHRNGQLKKINKDNQAQGKKKQSSLKIQSIKPFPEDTKKPTIDMDYSTADELLKAIPNTTDEHKLGHSVMYCVMLWYYGECENKEIGWKKFKKWEKTKERATPMRKGTWDKIAECEHIPSRLAIRNILEKFYGYIPNPREEAFTQGFYSYEERTEENGWTIGQDKYLQTDMINKKKYQIIGGNMGSGKTFITLDYIKKTKPKRVLWLVNRISMSQNLYGRIAEDDELPTFQNYKDITGDYSYADHLICEIESIHKININSEDFEKYDLVICDEIESLLNVFSQGTTHKVQGKPSNYTRNFQAFCGVIKDASQVFFMDAFLMKRTPKLVELIEQTDEPPTITTLFDFFGEEGKVATTWETKYINKITRCESVDLIKKTIHPHRKFHSWFNRLILDLQQGKNVYIKYPLRSGNKVERRKYYYDYSIEELGSMIAEASGLKPSDYIIYHGNTSNSIKHKLKNVNTEWSDKRFILTTSTISVGVNYDCDDHFDKIYLCYADFVSPRDVNQSLMRIRNTKEPIIEYFHITDMIKMMKRVKGEKFEPLGIEIPNANNLELYYGDTSFMSAFDFLQGHLKIEMACHGEGILRQYFKMTGYEWLYKLPTVDEYEGFSELGRGNCPWNYDDIAIITNEQKEFFYKKMVSFDETHTQAEQLQLDRHFNDNQIYGEGEEQDIVRRWLWANPKARIALKYKYKPVEVELTDYWKTWNIISDKQASMVAFTDEDKLKVAKSLYLADLDMGDQNASKYEARICKLKDNTIYKRMLVSVYGHEQSDGDFWEALAKMEESYIKFYKNPMESLLTGKCFMDDD